MAGGGLWHKILVYFGLADEEDDYEDETFTEVPDVESSYRERTNVRKLERTNRRRSASDFDDIFADEDFRGRSSSYARSSNNVRPLTTVSEPPPVRVHLVTPKNFNDAQIIADKFKSDIPVIINLQTSETELAKRLIDFASGLTYALDGGMQRVADKVFLLTPKNVEVSAEERQRLLEKGFFNQY
ncbi:MAG: cell division protein SepF [Thermoleophilia bacterium]|nr:cell division protein SepF [Thermoleophilia bacterium]